MYQGNSKEIVSSLIFEKKSLLTRIDILQTDLKNSQEKLENFKEENVHKSVYLNLQQEYQLKDYKNDQLIKELELKNREIIELKQEFEGISNQRISESERIMELNSRNQNLLSEFEHCNNVFDKTMKDFEEKQRNELNKYSQSLININKIMNSTKNAFLSLKEDREKLILKYKILNESHQTLNCRYSFILKLKNDFSHKIEIMNVYKFV